jgi:hypothetical protein
VRLNEIGGELDFCSACKIGYLKLTGEVVVKGQSAGEYRDIGTRRVFKCDNCEQRQFINDIILLIKNRFFKKF